MAAFLTTLHGQTTPAVMQNHLLWFEEEIVQEFQFYSLLGKNDGPDISNGVT